jgi:hypothetical protein
MLDGIGPAEKKYGFAAKGHRRLHITPFSLFHSRCRHGSKNRQPNSYTIQEWSAIQWA